MEPTTIGFLGMACVLILLLLKMYIGLAMGLVGFLGFAYISGWEPAFGLLRTVPYTTFASEGMSVIPLFILMGAFAFESGMSEDLYRAVHKIFGGLKGGLAMATVAACACFAAISGSSLATAATLGRVAMPEMKKYKYDLGLATGSIAGRRLHRDSHSSKCYPHHLRHPHRTIHRQTVYGRRHPRHP